MVVTRQMQGREKRAALKYSGLVVCSPKTVPWTLEHTRLSFATCGARPDLSLSSPPVSRRTLVAATRAGRTLPFTVAVVAYSLYEARSSADFRACAEDPRYLAGFRKRSTDLANGKGAA